MRGVEETVMLLVPWLGEERRMCDVVGVLVVKEIITWLLSWTMINGWLTGDEALTRDSWRALK